MFSADILPQIFPKFKCGGFPPLQARINAPKKAKHTKKRGTPKSVPRNSRYAYILSGAEILKAVKILTITLRTARQRFNRACIRLSSATPILQAL